MTFVRKYYIPKSVKRIESITLRKVLQYTMALDEESKRNLILVIRTFLTELLALPTFLLFEVKPQCRSVYSNLATGYTRSTSYTRR